MEFNGKYRLHREMGSGRVTKMGEVGLEVGGGWQGGYEVMK